MDSITYDAAQQHRYYSHGQNPVATGLRNEHVQAELRALSSYAQPHYAPSGTPEPGPSHWTPSAWPGTGLSTTSALNSSLSVESSSHHEPQDVFDGGFQLPAPWAALSGPILNGVPGNVSLPFPAYDPTPMNRTSSAIVLPLATDTSLSSSRGYRRNTSEGNDVAEDDPYDTTTGGPNARFPKAKALHKAAWGASSRSESEPKSLAPPDTNKRSINGNHNFRRAASKEPPGPPHEPKSSSDSDSNHRLKSRLKHDQTEKRYRKRLNSQFENLLSALPARLIAESEGSIGGPDDRREKRISKADILMLAKGHIEQLERKQRELEGKNRQMAGRVEEESWRRLGCGEMRIS